MPAIRPISPRKETAKDYLAEADRSLLVQGNFRYRDFQQDGWGIGYFNGGFGSATFNNLGTSNPRNGVVNTDFPGLGHNPSQNPIAFPIGGRVIQ